MTKEIYEKIFEVVESIPYGKGLLWATGKILTFVSGVVYFAAILAMLVERAWLNALILLFVPAFSFVVVSVFRSVYNAPRPYEVYDLTPLIAKDTKGKSFPSRHVFSNLVIAGTVFWFYPYAGVLLMLMGILLAVIRVIMGVHFPKDVIAGALGGLCCGGIAELILLWLA